MTAARPETTARQRAVRRWVRLGFLIWAVVAQALLIDSVRTQGVPDALRRSSPAVTVVESPFGVELRPAEPRGGAALVFLCGSGIHPHAYLPLLRPIAEQGYAVAIMGLPYRFAPLRQHKDEAIRRVQRWIADHPDVPRWVVAGHSLGGKLAADVAARSPKLRAAYALVGTTHPRDEDLSRHPAAFTKIYATRDGVAPVEKIEANRRLLPHDTRWVEIEGGNHSQFGHYGRQLLDGRATISREAQQETTRKALIDALQSG